MEIGENNDNMAAGICGDLCSIAQLERSEEQMEAINFLRLEQEEITVGLQDLLEALEIVGDIVEDLKFKFLVSLNPANGCQGREVKYVDMKDELPIKTLNKMEQWIQFQEYLERKMASKLN